MAIRSFLEQYNFSGKTVIPFCTSGSSGLGSSVSVLSELCSGATFLAGRRFSGSSSSGEVETWLTEIGIKYRDVDNWLRKSE
jgi:hypothetical protein